MVPCHCYALEVISVPPFHLFRPQPSSGLYHMISGCADGYVRLWDIRTGKSVLQKQVQKTPVTAMAAHPRAPLLACGSHAQFLNVRPDCIILLYLRIFTNVVK